LFGLLFFLAIATTAHSFSFAVYGDRQGNSEVFSQLIQKLNADKSLSFAVSNGDFAVNGRPATYSEYSRQLKKIKIPVYQVLGNHDAVGGGRSRFKKYFGPAYYSFEKNGVLFVVLNNAFKGDFDTEQLAWLKKQLAGSGARYKFVFMHRPVFDPGEIIKDNLMSGRAITEELQSLFEKYRVNYVFAGHIHSYARQEKNGVVYLVTGGAGGRLHLPPEFGGFYHYVKVTVTDTGISDKIVRLYE
jgi:3',5'-cyclic AMP phosphodiesterase CpdA